MIVGALNLGGTVETVPNPVSIAELAIDKHAQTLLMHVRARKQLVDLPDNLAAKLRMSSTPTRPMPC
ncbi:MAG: hypothetical protein KF754_00630 [Planctomycetes bacterium]|nr:hypothetical protein [Planctomycetota bacterium]